MQLEQDQLTTQDLEYLRIAVSLALTSNDTLEDMPSTKIALRDKLYPKLDTLYYRSLKGEGVAE